MLEILPPPPLPCNANAAVAADAPTNRGAIYALPNPLASSSLVNRQRWCPMPYAPDARPAICVFSVASEHEERDERDVSMWYPKREILVPTDKEINIVNHGERERQRQPSPLIPEHIYFSINQSTLLHPTNQLKYRQPVRMPRKKRNRSSSLEVSWSWNLERRVETVLGFWPKIEHNKLSDTDV